MNDDTEQPGDEQSSGMSLGDIYFVLFRHKWMILLCAAAGLLGAAALFAIKPAQYQSEAKLFIRYVVEGRSLTPAGNDANTRVLNDQQDSIINTEAQILQSWDVAQQVAAAVGPERMLAQAGGGTNREQAAGLILSSLEIELPVNGSVIVLFFRHPDPEIAQQALNQVILAYIKKHAEMHQVIGVSNEVLIQETERLRSELAQTEEELRAAKSLAGVASLDEAKKAYTDEISKIRQNIFNTQAELAEHEALLKEAPNFAPVNSGVTNTGPETPVEQVNEYRRICERIDLLSRKEQQYLVVDMLRESSIPVQEVQGQIREAEKNKAALEKAYPRLASLGASLPRLSGQSTGTVIDPAGETVKIHSLNALLQTLNSQMERVQGEAARADAMESKILELQRKRELLDTDLKYLLTSLDQRDIKASLGSASSENISTIQWPSPAVKARSKSFRKKVQMVAIGGFLGGLALAFLTEMFLDRSVKRPSEVQTKLRLPLLISIPDISRNGHRRLARVMGRARSLLSEAAGRNGTRGTGPMQVAVWDRSHLLRRYCEGLRDRLIVHFEVRNLTQKPKLVAVTSCGKGVGVTSIAAGLAASLSETGDGNVLLVDMNAEQGASQQFYRGKPGCGLDDALASETMKSALIQANLEVDAGRPDNDRLPRALPVQFASLMPMLKAGDYDYIVFDMPPVSQTSMTPRLSRLMDMVLLVIESEKTSQDVVKHAASLLAASNANVSAVLNKTRTYVPTWLHQEFLNEL